MNQDERTTPELVEILNTSADRGALAGAASALARSADPAALSALERRLRDPGFLARLDDLGDDHVKTRGVKQVFSALADRPRPEVAALCLALADDPVFTGDPDRLTPLLLALIRVAPLGEDAVRLLERTNREGYFAFNAPLLARNASPNALALFERMIQDRGVPPERRVDCLHTAVVPHRTELPVLESAARLLKAPLEDPVYIGVVESVFDYKSKPWYGPAIGAPEPRPWSAASDPTLELALEIAAGVNLDAVPDALADRIDAAQVEIRHILKQRRA